MFKKYKIGKGVSIIFLFSVILITILYSFDRYINKKLESQLVVMNIQKKFQRDLDLES